MSEKLSFDGFIAKIHEVFDRLPDYRKFSPSTLFGEGGRIRYLCPIFSQSPSFLA
jgi:hypothetical protein